MTEYLDAALADLQATKTSWARLALAEKIDYLQRLRRRIARVAPAWVAASAKEKGLSADSPWVAEEWVGGPYAVLTSINAYQETLERLDAGRGVLDGFKVWTRPDGRVVVRVYPADLQERALLSGFTTDVWMQPSVTEESLRGTAAAFYRKRDPVGAVSLILGAGNVNSIPALDLLGKLFVDGEVAIVKFNPVNAYLGEFYEDAFAPLVDAGFVRFAYGGADVGEYLVRHPDVDNVHITGSADTHDAIVYGSGAEGAARKERDEPLVDKPVTSELGGVGPTIVVPGPWTDADLAFQAEHIASQKLANAGFNCIASQVLVLPADWEGSERLLDHLRAVFTRYPGRDSFYPGSRERRERVLELNGTAEIYGDPDSPVIMVPKLDASDIGNHCFTSEFFAPILAVTDLNGNGSDYLSTAVNFANETLAGTLGANIVAHPTTMRGLGSSFEGALTELEYGTIGINTWSAFGFLIPRAPWGAFPGHSRQDIGSGVGVVHNALLLEQPERTVVTAPFGPFHRGLSTREFHMAPRPFWFIEHRNAAATAERLTRYAGDPSWRHFPPLVSAALRG
jgi:aldehyde dehydrogenase (NAD(P)+)